MKGTLQKENRTQNENSYEQDKAYVSPEVNIFETGDGYVLEAEMAGVSKDGIEITLEDNELTIIGRRSKECAAGEPLFCECSKADYRRIFALDPAIDTSKIVARMDQGVLTLTLPKSERVKPRRVTVE